MKKLLLSSAILIALIIGCRQMPVQPDISQIEPTLPSTPFEYNSINTPNGNVTVLYEDSKVIDNKKATIGRVLFYDKALSYNNSTACASCHKQENGFADTKQFSTGFKGFPTKRNSLSIGNLYQFRNTGYFWDVRESKIESMVFRPIQDHIEMGFENIDLITEKISNLPYYKKLFKDCYGDENISIARMRESLGNFLFSIVNSNSKFDRAQKNKFADFNSAELNGMNLFINNGCSECHFINSDFSPKGAQRDKLANVGLDMNEPDNGNKGLYRIPDLRNISLSGPYMHDGRFTTLNEVILHYGSGIQHNQYLSDELKEKKPGVTPNSYYGVSQSNIVDFLKTLKDDYTTTDERFSSPFKSK